MVVRAPSPARPPRATGRRRRHPPARCRSLRTPCGAPSRRRRRATRTRPSPMSVWVRSDKRDDAFGNAVFGLEDLPDVGRRHFAALRVHHGLHDLAELDLQAARQLEAVLGLEQVGDAALARLAVDADDRVVAAARGPPGRSAGRACPRRRLRVRAAKPFLIASWCEPENAVKTRSPTYGWRGCTGSWLQCSTTRRISSMSEKSSPGSTPCVYRFSASVTRSTLPVRSPLPNRQPSTRSAPAITASSAAAMPVPRSLCGCTRQHDANRAARGCGASTRSCRRRCWACECSTVAGRLMMHLRSGVGCQISVTASQTRLREVELGAGEHLRASTRSASRCRAARRPGR